MNANPTRAIRGLREGPFCAAAFISAKLQCNLRALCMCPAPHGRWECKCWRQALQTGRATVRGKGQRLGAGGSEFISRLHHCLTM